MNLFDSLKKIVSWIIVIKFFDMSTKRHTFSKKSHIFQSCFSQKAEPEVRRKEYGLDYGDPQLKLGNNGFSFIYGNWIIDEEHTILLKSNIKQLEKENSQLREENNFLKLKIAVLLNMCSELKIKGGSKYKKLKNSSAAEDE